MALQVETPQVLAPALLSPGDHGAWRWIVVACPLCGERGHVHGGGLIVNPDGGVADDPRAYLGERVPHCGTTCPRCGNRHVHLNAQTRCPAPVDAYELVDVRPARTAAMVRFLLDAAAPALRAAIERGRIRRIAAEVHDFSLEYDRNAECPSGAVWKGKR